MPTVLQIVPQRKAGANAMTFMYRNPRVDAEHAGVAKNSSAEKNISAAVDDVVLVYRFASAWREAVRIMTQRMLNAILVAVVAGLLIGAGIACAVAP